MKRYVISILAIAAVLSVSAVVLAQQDKNENNDVSKGTEIVDITKGHKMIVHEGAKIERIGSQIKIEDPVEHLLDKVSVIEDQLKRIEKRQDEIKKQLEDKKEEKADLRELEISIRRLKEDQENLRQSIGHLRNRVNDIDIKLKAESK